MHYLYLLKILLYNLAVVKTLSCIKEDVHDISAALSARREASRERITVRPELLTAMVSH